MWQPLAQRGNAVAQNWLGRMYQQGLGVTRMRPRPCACSGGAAAWLCRSPGNLGSLYAEGRGVARDEEPRRYASTGRQPRRAMPQPRATWDSCTPRGRGVARDETEAVRLYQQAAARGQPWARATWDSCTPRGGVVAKDETEAVRLYRQAAARGLAAGQAVWDSCTPRAGRGQG